MNKAIQRIINELEDKIQSFTPNPQYTHDKFILITLQEAISAVKEGNFGVGAVLVHKNGEIVQKGHNRVFKPYFRSDRHAEMDVMTKFEEDFKDINNLKDYSLFSSLEPCPMCFLRLIISGVKNVYYAAIDKNGGMVRRIKYMPPEWNKLAQRQEFALAQCSPELRDIALQIFLSTVEKNDNKLKNRSI